MNPTMFNAIAAEHNQDLRDHAAAIRLVREARRAQRAQHAFQAHSRPAQRSAEPAINPCPAVAAR